jgi:hypothetical protein
MPTASRPAYGFVRGSVCPAIMFLGVAACASDVATPAEGREVAAVGQALACTADVECAWSATPICEGGACVECSVDDHCWWGQVCSQGRCVEPAVARSINQTCEADASAQGNCDARLICMAVGGGIPHCLPSGPCATNAELVFGTFCAMPCSGTPGAEHHGGYIEGASCPAAAPNCWENNFTESSDDGWCIP